MSSLSPPGTCLHSFLSRVGFSIPAARRRESNVCYLTLSRPPLSKYHARKSPCENVLGETRFHEIDVNRHADDLLCTKPTATPMKERKETTNQNREHKSKKIKGKKKEDTAVYLYVCVVFARKVYWCLAWHNCCARLHYCCEPCDDTQLTKTILQAFKFLLIRTYLVARARLLSVEGTTLYGCFWSIRKTS